MNYYDVYYFNVCHVCKERTNVKLCKNCKYVKYCSITHQKLDWPMHKHICKAVSNSRISPGSFELHSFQKWTDYRVSLYKKWRNVLKRELYPYENQMWMFLPACSLCYSEEVTQICSSCSNVFYCSSSHQDQYDSKHKLYCGNLRLCMEIDLFLLRTKQYPDCKINLLPKNYNQFPENNLKFLECFVEGNCKNEIDIVLKYDMLAPSAIILYVLIIADIINNRLVHKSDIVLHIVGASNTEITFDWQIITELIFHYVLDLLFLKIYLIGPSCEQSLLKPISASDYCCECIKLSKNADLKVFTSLYHSLEICLKKPDLIVLFNSGLHEFEDQKESDTWTQSIPYLLNNKNAPVVITAYTEEEIIKDSQRLIDFSRKKLKFLIKCENNPYRNLRPFRDWHTEDKPIFYCNNYLSVVESND